MRGLLFDLDGTLIDSMPLHQRAWQRWRESVGLPRHDGEHFTQTAGRSNAEILADLYPRHGVQAREAMAEAKEAIYRELAAIELRAVPGALDFMAAAAREGLALAICTAAPLGNIAVAFERFAFADLVKVTTSPADGLRGKPHPDIFAEAARRLGIDPCDCLVFEDAPLGVEAAHRAGMRAVALTTTLGSDHFTGFPNLVATAPDFLGLDLHTLRAHIHA